MFLSPINGLGRTRLTGVYKHFVPLGLRQGCALLSGRFFFLAVQRVLRLHGNRGKRLRLVDGEIG